MIKTDLRLVTNQKVSGSIPHFEVSLGTQPLMAEKKNCI